MALFKVHRGKEANLPAAKNDGWAYFCTNTGNFYIDWADGGKLTRAQVNARCAENIRYIDGDAYVEIPSSDIASALAKAHTHENGTVLNDISSTDVASWNSKSTIRCSESEPQDLGNNQLWFQLINQYA